MLMWSKCRHSKYKFFYIPYRWDYDKNVLYVLLNCYVFSFIMQYIYVQRQFIIIVMQFWCENVASKEGA